MKLIQYEKKLEELESSEKEVPLKLVKCLSYVKLQTNRTPTDVRV